MNTIIFIFALLMLLKIMQESYFNYLMSNGEPLRSYTKYLLVRVIINLIFFVVVVVWGIKTIYGK